MGAGYSLVCVRHIVKFSPLAGLVLVAACGCGRSSEPERPAQVADAVSVTRQPVSVVTHTFEPAAPPAEMPPLSEGEQAECASDFVASASVSGDSRKTDATHATLTVTRVKMTLQLRINLWVPEGVTQHVMDHEEGHHQISEHFYEGAERIARLVAAGYIGKKVSVNGANLDAEIDRALQKMSADVTDEYNRKVSPEAAQMRFDELTDHARNEVVAAEAVARAIQSSAQN